MGLACGPASGGATTTAGEGAGQWTVDGERMGRKWAEGERVAAQLDQKNGPDGKKAIVFFCLFISIIKYIYIHIRWI
jgi:hypothetical protein